LQGFFAFGGDGGLSASASVLAAIESRCTAVASVIAGWMGLIPAMAKAEALAFRVLAERLELGEAFAVDICMSLPAAPVASGN